jgi:hypothetical protein
MLRNPGRDLPIHGAWAHLGLPLDRNLKGAPEGELRLVLDIARTPGDAFDPI